MDPIASDLLLSALRIPSTITTLLLSGTIITAALPIMTRLDHDAHESLRDNDPNSDSQHEISKTVSPYLNLILLIVLSSLFFLNIFVLIFTPQLLEWTTSHEIWQTFQEQGLVADYILTSRILLISPLALGIQSVLGIFLTLKKRFTIYSWAGVIYNAGTLIGLLVGGHNGYIAAALGMMAGIVATAVLFAWECRNVGFTWMLKTWSEIIGAIRLFRPELIQTWQTFWPRIFILNGVVVAGILMNLVAQTPGQITYFDIGLSIQEIFLTIVASVGTVFFPDLARLALQKKGDLRGKIRTYSLGVGGLGLLGVFATLVGAPVVVWFFEIFGKGQNSGEYIIFIARISTISLLFQSLNEITFKYFYVRQKVWEPALLSLFSTFLQVVAVYGLIMLNSDAGLAVCLGLAVNNLSLWLGSLYFIDRDQAKVELASD